jgi:hypothetical protein
MIFMYIVLGTASLLLFSVGLAVMEQKKLKVAVVSRESIHKKEFFALRIESEDFLFVKDQDDVSFIQALDDVNDFEMMDLEKHEAPLTRLRAVKEEMKTLKEKAEIEDKLIMPKTEKKVS